jgi:hypothetical protein
MNKRPVVVTVIAWYLMVTCGFGALMIPFTLRNPLAQDLMAKNPLPIWFQYTHMAVGLAIGIGAGFFMLKGKRWARSLYISWTALSLVLGAVTSPFKLALIPGVVVFAVTVVLLFLPIVKPFFADPTHENRI